MVCSLILEVQKNNPDHTFSFHGQEGELGEEKFVLF